MSFKRGLQKNKTHRFRYDTVDFTNTESDQSDLNSEQGIPLKGNSLLMQCIDIVNRAMKLEDYRLHRGKIYSKVPESKYSFISCCSIGAFLDTLVANLNFTDVLARTLKKLEELLFRSTCQLIIQIEIDYNLIEVKPYGVCFSIAEQEFVTSPISYPGIGKITPKAYVDYTYEPSRVPLPKSFIDSLENSFPGVDICRNFLRKYYQLFLHKKFPTKTKKLCATGEINSGKSTWFSLFIGIIPTDCIAGITCEKQFAGHLINENTEVVIMDEWSIDSLNAEDAKKVLQGGLVTLPRNTRRPKNLLTVQVFISQQMRCQILSRDLMTGQLNAGFPYLKLYPFLIHATEYQTG